MSSNTVTMNDVDFDKYKGVWYEIAKYPNIFQSRCDKAKATYFWDNDKKSFIIINECIKNDKTIYSAKGYGRVPDMNQKGKLKVIFPGYGREEGDYWIRWTDYQDAIVGDDKLLWWLSRKPKVRPEEVEPMLKRIRTFGYNTDKLMAHPSVMDKSRK